MNFKEFIAEVAKDTGLPEATVETVLVLARETITDICAEGGIVSYSCLGTFATRESGERQGRNPMTGEPYVITARRQPKFTPSDKLKARVMGS